MRVPSLITPVHCITITEEPKVYTISIDTKIISKILELLLFPIFDNFARCNQLKIEGCISLMQKYQQSAIISDP
ncbi:MAG: hypothetical protein O9290_21710 [Microcystis sp. LE19-41.2A]|uniref:type II restriction endonuclease n=1 Tax=Microcystis sp. LE19-41.2A TaxID=3016427 RepID=UPI0022CCA0E1|nr:type II restriction endonuclease [Microcystis sp. LE19-41.2A]MCZ8049174.1 hypothetical protein [Microcystis sp. LE19-41.2A]